MLQFYLQVDSLVVSRSVPAYFPVVQSCLSPLASVLAHAAVSIPLALIAFTSFPSLFFLHRMCR